MEIIQKAVNYLMTINSQNGNQAHGGDHLQEGEINY